MHQTSRKPASKIRFATCVIALPALLVSMANAKAQAQVLSARYAVSFVGFPIGKAQLSGVFGPRAYKISAGAKLAGIAKAVSRARGAAQSSGEIRNGKLLPAGYATSSSNSKKARTVRMGMRNGNVRAVDISPPIPNRPGRIPLSASHKRNIIDPLSALVVPIPGNAPITGATACNRVLPVFDGYTRFNIALRYAGTRIVKAKGYKGPVFVCKARYRPIAGHRPHRKATQFMAANKKMEVWIAPLGASRVLAPFRIAVNSMIGMVVIEARTFRIGNSPATATATR